MRLPALSERPRETGGGSRRLADAWTRITADLSPWQYDSFAEFVARTDPGARPDDIDRLYALRVTWAFGHDPAGYP